MDKRYFFELTNKLYRMTLSFPKQETLRRRMRGLADEILMDLVVILEGDQKEKRDAAFNVEKNIRLLDTCFELSKNQNWVEIEELKNIQSDYLVIKREVEEFNNNNRKEMKEEVKEEVKEKITAPDKKETSKPLSKRQEKIMEFLKEKEKAQVKDIQEILPKITKRTLRRDLAVLTEQGKLKKIGKGNMTYYQI